MNKVFWDWAKEHDSYGRTILEEWTGRDKENRSIDCKLIEWNSDIKMIWKCKKCHNSWLEPISQRTQSNTSCPACNEIKKIEKRKKSVKKGVNDFYTWCCNSGAYGKRLLKEWTGFDEKNIIVDPLEIARGSNLHVQWQCSFCGNIWNQSIGARTGKNRVGCPRCNKRGTSYPEQFIYQSMLQVFPECGNRGKYRGYEYDIIIKEKNTFIEYSNSFTHKGKEERDAAKADICKRDGIKFILIYEDTYNEMSHCFTNNYICFHLMPRKQNEQLIEITEYLLKVFGVKANLNYAEISELAFESSHGYIPFEESLSGIFPNLAAEWHEKLNGRRRPDTISPMAQENIFWVCRHCGYGENGEWNSSLSNRSHLKQGCPACGYNWYDQKIHPSSTSVVIKGKTDLASQYPILLKEWNYELNKESPENVRAVAHKRIKWTCSKCGYGKNGEWNKAIYTRTQQKSGCPICGYNIFDNKYHITSGSARIVEGKNDLFSQYPDIVPEWCDELNQGMDPHNIRTNAKKPIYWRCTKCGYGNNGEWCVRIGDRIKYKSGCPACGYNWVDGKYHTIGSNALVIGKDDLASVYPNLAKEWSLKYNGDNKPTHVRSSSHDEVYWECPNCHYGSTGEWKNTVNSRVNQKSGCRVCGYNWYDGTFHKTTGRSYVMQGFNDLSFTHPKLAEEWNYEKNKTLLPTQVKAGSHKHVYWICPNCKYGKNEDWLYDIHIRASRKSGCPICGYNWYRAQTNQPQKYKKGFENT